MITIRTLPQFDQWLAAIKDKKTAVRLLRRLDRLQAGQFGDIKPVGEGVFELREHFGSGWRMYYIRRGDALIIMLGGGDKSTQDADIAKAIRLAISLED